MCTISCMNTHHKLHAQTWSSAAYSSSLMILGMPLACCTASQLAWLCARPSSRVSTAFSKSEGSSWLGCRRATRLPTAPASLEWFPTQISEKQKGQLLMDFFFPFFYLILVMNEPRSVIEQVWLRSVFTTCYIGCIELVYHQIEH